MLPKIPHGIKARWVLGDQTRLSTHHNGLIVNHSSLLDYQLLIQEDSPETGTQVSTDSALGHVWPGMQKAC